MTEAAPLDLGDPGRVVVITAAGSEFGLPVEMVQEVVRVPPITRLPFPPPTVRGVASIRGEVVTVMDLGMRLLGRRSADERRLVVVQDPATGEKIGLLVEEVSGLVQESSEAAAPPETLASLPEGWIARVITPAPDRVVTVLDLEAVLTITDSEVEERI